MYVTETIDHGAYLYTSLPFEVTGADDIAAMMAQSPYYRRRTLSDSALLQMFDDLTRDGRTYFGWADYDVVAASDTNISELI